MKYFNLNLPLFKMAIDKANKLTGVDELSLVDYPAMQTKWIAFNKQTPNNMTQFKIKKIESEQRVNIIEAIKSEQKDWKKRDFSHEDLRARQFTGAYFNGLILRGAAMNNCTFKNCNFNNADLTNANISDTTFENCNMDGAILVNTTRNANTKFDKCSGSSVYTAMQMRCNDIAKGIEMKKERVKKHWL